MWHFHATTVTIDNYFQLLTGTDLRWILISQTKRNISVSNRNPFYLFPKWLSNDRGKIMVGFNFKIKHITLYSKWLKLESPKLAHMVWVWLNLEIMNLHNRAHRSLAPKELHHAKKVIKNKWWLLHLS